MTTGKTISGSASLLVLVAFFLPWITVSCNDVAVGSVTGARLAAGDPLAGIGATPLLYFVPASAILILVFVGLAYLSRLGNQQAAYGAIAMAAAAAGTLAYVWLTIGNSMQVDGINLDIEPGGILTGVGIVGSLIGGILELLPRRGGAPTRRMSNSATSTGSASGYVQGSYTASDAEYLAGADPAAVISYTPVGGSDATRQYGNEPPTPGDRPTRAVFQNPTPPPLLGEAGLAGGAFPPASGATHTELLYQQPSAFAWLTVVSGFRAGHSFALSDSNSIGRGAQNDIVLDDSAASDVHARLRLRDGEFYIHDLDSTNGTYLTSHDGAERTIVRETLHDGDRIRIGRTVLHFTKIDTDTGSQ